MNATEKFLASLKARRDNKTTETENTSGSLWSADPHVYGPGKIHIVNVENTVKTMCGKWVNKIPGKFVSGNATCQVCINAVENLKERRARQEHWRREGWQRSYNEQEDREWWKAYDAYLLTPAWRQKADAVMRRAGGICEGCGKQPANQVHHLSYKHVKLLPGCGLVCEELLWDLRAVCNACHRRIHK